MSSFATSWAWKQDIKPAARKFILVALADFADSEGVCRVSQIELAEMTGQGRRSVVDHLSGLEEADLITREAQWGEDGYRQVDAIRLLALQPGQKRRKCVQQGENPGLGANFAHTHLLGANSAHGTASLGANFAHQERSLIPIEIKDLSNNTNAPSEPSAQGHPLGEDVGGFAGGLVPELSPTLEGQAPDGAADAETNPTPASPVQAVHVTQDQEGENAPSKQVLPPPPSPYRAAMATITEAGLLPVWRDWVKLNALGTVTQEAQAPRWQLWISEGQGGLLGEQAQDIIESGSFTHPWGALRARMGKHAAAQAAHAAQTPPASTFEVGQQVRYPDGSLARVVAVRSHGITTTHPVYPDVPQAHIADLVVSRGD